MFKKWFGDWSVVSWILSRDYEKSLLPLLKHSEVKERFLCALRLGQDLFPFINEGYFPGYEGLKRQVEQKLNTKVVEMPLPETLFGSYLPSSSQRKDAILINKNIDPLYRLPTLAHELSHLVIHHAEQTHAEVSESDCRYRLKEFWKSLEDPEELLSDALVSVGTYPRDDFKKRFGSSFNWRTGLRAFGHLREHYEEVTRRFFFRPWMIFHVALIFHYVRLRFLILKEYGL